MKSQAWKFIWDDNETAGLVIKSKRAIKKKLHIYMTDDLTFEERQLKKSRKWAYDLLVKEDSCWVQWRFADIYVNETMEFDEEAQDSEGRPLMINRGRWTCLTEQDYKGLANEKAAEQGMEEGA